jgi:ADP-ribose pyrophosphatase
MKPWKTISKTAILSYGKFLTVENHVVELPDGRVIDDWPWLITPDFINVVAITTEGHFLCFEQVKYGLVGDSLAVVGGFIEPGEDPLVAAQRELIEETGYRAEQWTALGQYRVDPNRGAGTGYLYLAREAVKVTQPTADDLEEQHLLLLSQAEMYEALLAGRFKSMAWTANLALALLQLKL